ncbi:RNA polymerase Rpb1, domain 1 family protein, partial [Chlamydia psittaci 03DC29]
KTYVTGSRGRSI